MQAKSLLKNLFWLAVIVTFGAFAYLTWSPDSGSITGVSAEDVSVSIAQKVEKNFGDVTVRSTVMQPDESKNQVTVQYVAILNVEPSVLNAQPTTQAEADKQQAAYDELQGTIADLLSLSQTHLTKQNPTVIAVRVTVILLDGEIYDGIVASSDLNSVPATAKASDWLTIVALQPVVMLPQSVWDEISSLPDVQKKLASK